MSNVANDKQRWTLTDFLRAIFKGRLDPLANFFNRIGLHPNVMTVIGLAGNTLGAFLISQGQIQWGGLVVLIMGPVDALDGTMARLRGETQNFGAFVDSVTDRYSELVIFGGLLYYYIQQSDSLSLIGVFLATAGSVLVSYVRARAQSLGYETKVGVLTRVERYLVMSLSLLLNYPWVGVWILAIFANLTAIQRIFDVRSQAYGLDQKKK